MGDYLAHLQLESTCANTVDPSDILPRLGLTAVAKREGTIDEYQLQLDTARIAGVYQRLGYFSVEVKSKVVKLDRAYPDAATLVFTVTPNKRATVHLEYFGLPDNVPFSKVRDVVPIKEGAAFDYEVYNATKDPLLDLLLDIVYAHSLVEVTVIAFRAHARSTIRFVADPGPASTFGEITIQGVTEPMLVDALRARIKWTTGEPGARRARGAARGAGGGGGRGGTGR